MCVCVCACVCVCVCVCLVERTNVCLYINVEDIIHVYFTEYDLISELT